MLYDVSQTPTRLSCDSPPTMMDWKSVAGEPRVTDSSEMGLSPPSRSASSIRPSAVIWNAELPRRFWFLFFFCREPEAAVLTTAPQATGLTGEIQLKEDKSHLPLRRERQSVKYFSVSA